jgi:hypothetical protein
MKASGFFDLRIGAEAILSNPSETQQIFIPSRPVHFKQGLYPFSLRYRPVKDDYRLLRLYWTVPAFGLYRSLISREYFFAEPPSNFKLALFTLNRFKLLVPLLSLMLIWALPDTRSQTCSARV